MIEKILLGIVTNEGMPLALVLRAAEQILDLAKTGGPGFATSTFQQVKQRLEGLLAPGALAPKDQLDVIAVYCRYGGV